jgi:hypothetical protein
MFESHVSDIARVIQLSVAPVFMLTAIATLINALTGRFGRAVDRRRVLEQRILEADGTGREQFSVELDLLTQRTTLILWSIASAVISGLLICVLIGMAFLGAFVSVDLAKPVAVLFVAAVGALTACLLFFLREVFLAKLSVEHAVRPFQARVARSQDTAKPK